MSKAVSVWSKETVVIGMTPILALAAFLKCAFIKLDKSPGSHLETRIISPFSELDVLCHITPGSD